MAEIIDLAEFRSAHPPLARLITAQFRTFEAWARYNRILVSAWLREVSGP